MESIKDFLDACKDAGARPLFVSKDSHLKIIKDYLIFTALQRLLAGGHVDGEDLELLSRGGPSSTPCPGYGAGGRGWLRLPVSIRGLTATS